MIVSCDWGTSSFRLRLVEATTGRVAAELATADGARALAAPGLTAAQRAGVFHDLLQCRLGELVARTGIDADGLPVFISGMASSSIGWRELPYTPLPVDVDGGGLLTAALPDLACGGAVLPVTLISGLRTAGDVLRGEEMEIVGLLQAPALAACRARALLLLPGTHSKHVRVERERIVGFTTCMTGELFSLLAEHSVLAHSVRDDGGPADPAGEDDAFAEGVADAGRQPLPRALFRVRTRQLLDGAPAALNRAYLDGLLLGSEAHGLRAELPADCPVLLCAAGRVAARYARALALLGLSCLTPPAELVAHAVPLGHLAVARRLFG